MNNFRVSQDAGGVKAYWFSFNWPTAFLTKKLMVVLHFTLQVACIAVIDLSNARPRSQRRSEDYGGRHQLRKEGTKDSDVSVC